jgi:hypothetical protein
LQDCCAVWRAWSGAVMYLALDVAHTRPLALMKSAAPPIKASRFVALGTGRGLLIPGSTGSPSTHNHPCKSRSTRRSRRCDRCLLLKQTSVAHDGPDDAGYFVGDRHSRHLGRSSRQNAREPAGFRCLRPRIADQSAGGDHQQFADVAIAPLGDPPQPSPSEGLASGSGSRTSAPGPIPPEPMARPSASSKPPCANGIKLMNQ